MKILIIRNYPSYMDVVNNTYNIQEVGLAKALVRKGHICDIIFWTNKEEKIVEIPVDECGVIKIYYKKGITALKNTVFLGCDKLFKAYDILQPCEYNQMQAWLLAQKYPQKTIVYHGPYYSPFNKRYNLMCLIFDKLFLGRYLKLNTKFITKSNLAQEFLVSKGIKESNVASVGVGIDTQMLSNVQNQCAEPLYLTMKQDNDLKILYIGKFEKRRNIPFIFDTFSAVLKKNANATLYMIGTGEKEYVETCWKHADELGIREHIVYQERMEQKYLSQIYELADFFILPTEYEIFGMVLLETMYYRTVVLTTNNGGSSTLIDNKYNGYIMDTLNSQKWADCIDEVFLNKIKMVEIRDAASKKIDEEFMWDKLAKHFISQYRKVIQ